MQAQLQYDHPLFVRDRYQPVVWKGKMFNFQDHFPWKELTVPEDVIFALWGAGRLYHDPSLEKEQKVGDRLEEFDIDKLERLVDSLNLEVKRLTTSTTEYERKKIKKSKIRDKQIGLLRSWKRNNLWAEDNFFTERDKILSEIESKV